MKRGGVTRDREISAKQIQVGRTVLRWFKAEKGAVQRDSETDAE